MTAPNGEAPTGEARTARPTAYGIVARLREHLGLDPKAPEDEVMAALEEHMGSGKKEKKGKKDDAKE